MNSYPQLRRDILELSDARPVRFSQRTTPRIQVMDESGAMVTNEDPGSNDKLAVYARGHWQLLKNGHVALSRVWHEELFADAYKRGLPRLVVE